MVYRRRVVEDRNPMGPILGIIAIIVLLFVAWMLFRDGFDFGDGDEPEVVETTEAPTEPAEDPEASVDIPAVDQGVPPAPPANEEQPADGGSAPGG